MKRRVGQQLAQIRTESQQGIWTYFPAAKRRPGYFQKPSTGYLHECDRYFDRIHLP